MRIFVAGATGVLGQPTVKLLVDAGHQVRGTARGEEKSQLLRSLGAEPVAVDLYDAAAVKEAVAGSEAVIHIATKIPPIMKMRSRGNWTENDRLRREATKNLVDGGDRRRCADVHRRVDHLRLRRRRRPLAGRELAYEARPGLPSTRRLT